MQTVERDSLFTQVLQARRQTGTDQIGCAIFDSKITDYEATFSKLLGQKSIRDLLQERQKRQEKTFTLDLMAAGQAVRDLANEERIDGGLSLTLTDIRDEQTKAIDSTKNLQVIEGNILYGSAWNQIHKWLQKQEISDKGFDLVICRPLCGFTTIPPNPRLFEMLLWRTISLLDPDGGMLLTETPTQLGSALTGRWTKAINQYPGIDAVFVPREFILRVTRNQQEPYYEQTIQARNFTLQEASPNPAP